MWNKHDCALIKHSLVLPFFGIGMKTDLFQSCVHYRVFQINWYIECRTLTSSFRILNSSAGIPWSPLALFIVMLSKDHLTSQYRISGSRWATSPLRLSGSLRSFFTWFFCVLFSSVQFSCSVMCNSLWPHGLQHARLPCPPPTPGACSDSCPMSQWCNPTTLCHSLLLLPSIFPSIRVFSNESVIHIRWPKYWSFRFSISPSNKYSGLISFRINWFDLLAVQGTLKSLLQHHSSKATLMSIQDFWKNHSLDYMDLCRQSIVSVFNMKSRLIIAFLSRSKHLLISWLQSPSAVILEPPKIKSLTVSIVSLSIWHEVMRLYVMVLVFWMLSFKLAFSLSSFTIMKRLFSSLLFAIRVLSFVYLKLLIILPAILTSVCASFGPTFCISSVIVYSLDILISWSETSLLYHVWF